LTGAGRCRAELKVYVSKLDPALAKRALQELEAVLKEFIQVPENWEDIDDIGAVFNNVVDLIDLTTDGINFLG